MSPRNGMGWWRRVTLRDVVLFTLPPIALAVWLLGGAVLDYRRARQFDDWWAAQTSVRKFAWHNARTALRTPQIAALDARMNAEDESKPLLRLMVDTADWKRIDGDVGAHWGEWIDATIRDGGDNFDAELRWRGDGSAHWSTEKKSFTLKTKRGELYKGFRAMAFSVKDVLPQFLIGTLAKDFGLLAPEQQIVPVYVNDRFYGLHRFVEPVDESFLRRNLRMPGNVFRGDTAERGDYFKGLPREVFANPHIWDRAANNDRPGAFGTSLLAEFLRDLNTSDFAGHERFMSWLDRDELSRLLAFLLVAGDPYHMSGVHNQLWYEDPTSGTLHPVVWDVRLLDLEKPPPRSNINRFWRAALKDPRVWDGTMRELAKRLEGDELMRTAERRVNAAWELFRDEFEYETLRSGVVPPVGDPQSTLATLRRNVETLRSWIADSRAEFAFAHGADALVVDFIVTGRVACELTNIAPSPSAWTLDSNGNGVLDAEDAPMTDWLTRTAAGEPRLRLMAGVKPALAELAAAPVHYRMFLRTDLRGPLDDLIRFESVNALTGVPADVPDEQRAGALPTAGELFHPWRSLRRAMQAVELTGDVHLSADLTIEPDQSLKIVAGATITMEPDVSLDIRGHIEALGTEERPITFQRANPELPWGVIALQGAGANGSRFDHVRFLGGGARQVGRVEYKGSVCVHNAFDVAFTNCEFAHNSRCDDLINIVKGEASITHSHFHHANADSIDYDMSGGLVAHNLIEGSGNDGLDLMTCWPRVIDNRIVASGDKGISIGEDSSPLVFDNVIRDCVRGIEVKDRSSPTVLNTSIENCERGVYAHMKNWRYGEAGWPVIARSLVSGNKTEYLAEDGARRTLAAAQIGPISDALPLDEDLAWLARELGLRDVPSGIGPVDGYTLGRAIAPIHRGKFEEDFVSVARGWQGDGHVRRINQRAHDLCISFEREHGAARTAVAWDLNDASLDYLLVLEASGEGLTSARARAHHAIGALEVELTLDADPATYRYTTLQLAHGRYSALELSAKGAQDRARLRLHSWRVLGFPREGTR